MQISESAVDVAVDAKKSAQEYIGEVPPFASRTVVVHEVVVACGDVEAVALFAVELLDALLPVTQGVGIGVYGDIVAEEGHEHLGLEVGLAAGGEPYAVGADEAHDEGGLLAFDQTKGGLP